MDEKKDKNPAQVMLTRQEYLTVKHVAYYRNFRSVSAYIRHLLDKDVSDAKRRHPFPDIFGFMTTAEYKQLSHEERERYLSGMATVKPNALNEFIRDKGGKPISTGKLDELGL